MNRANKGKEKEEIQKQRNIESKKQRKRETVKTEEQRNRAT